jgi:hypothetical protein
MTLNPTHVQVDHGSVYFNNPFRGELFA